MLQIIKDRSCVLSDDIYIGKIVFGFEMKNDRDDRQSDFARGLPSVLILMLPESHLVADLWVRGSQADAVLVGIFLNGWRAAMRFVAPPVSVTSWAPKSPSEGRCPEAHTAPLRMSVPYLLEQQAVEILRSAGCVHEQRRNKEHGVTTGWWKDNKYLASSARLAVENLQDSDSKQTTRPR